MTTQIRSMTEAEQRVLLEWAAAEGWTAGERDHVCACAYCQKVMAMEWRAECPGLATLAAYLADLCPDKPSLTVHLNVDRCSRCARMLESPWLQAAAKLIRGGQRTLESMRAAFDGVLVGFAPVPVAARSPGAPPRAPFRLLATHSQGLLEVEVAENDQKQLEATVRSKDAGLNGRIVVIELIAEHDMLTLETELRIEGKGKIECLGRAVFGEMHKIWPKIGKDCAVLAWLKD